MAQYHPLVVLRQQRRAHHATCMNNDVTKNYNAEYKVDRVVCRIRPRMICLIAAAVAFVLTYATSTRPLPGSTTRNTLSFEDFHNHVTSFDAVSRERYFEPESLGDGHVERKSPLTSLEANTLTMGKGAFEQPKTYATEIAQGAHCRCINGEYTVKSCKDKVIAQAAKSTCSRLYRHATQVPYSLIFAREMTFDELRASRLVMTLVCEKN